MQSALVVRFFAEAMQDKKIVKGLLCHGLWILTPNPKLLHGRKVICHSVVMPDILNCGGVITLTPDRVPRPPRSISPRPAVVSGPAESVPRDIDRQVHRG